MKTFKTFVESWRKETPWRKVKDGDRKDKYGNTVKTKNIAKNLARSAMKKTAAGKTEDMSKDKEKHDAAMRKLRDAPKGSPWMKKAGKDAKMLRYVLNRDVK